MNIYKIILDKVNNIINSIGININEISINITKIKNKKFGDYQINGLINYSIKNNINCRILANKIIKKFDIKNIIYKYNINNIGIINLFVHHKLLFNNINNMLNTRKFGILCNSNKNYKIIIDYSSPNIAKKMHVGHLRSMVIGDCVSRTLKYLNYNVININHIGDWGTQFGMIIAYIKINNIDIYNNKFNLKYLENIYVKSRYKFDNDYNFSTLSRMYVVKLQNGDEFCKKIWLKIVNLNINNNQNLYKKLNISLNKKNIIGESFYNNMLNNIVNDLINKNMASYSNGAIIAFTNKTLSNNKFKYKNKIIIKKKDGGYLYSAIDIASIKYRCSHIKANRIIYYIDNRQNKYIKKIYSIALKANYISNNILFEHHYFGLVLDKNNKPFKTRYGNTYKLSLLINRVSKKIKFIILKKNPNLILNNNFNKLINNLSIGSIKYFDLSKNRIKNYVFNINKIVDVNDNSLLYIQYSYIRIISILNKISNKNKYFNYNEILLINEKEITISKFFLDYENILYDVCTYGKPHIMCNYLFKLSLAFSSFYEQCEILKIIEFNETLFNSRVKILILISKIIKNSLNLLGINVFNYI